LTEQAGFAPEDLVFDPNILAIATGIAEHSEYGAHFIQSIQLIPDLDINMLDHLKKKKEKMMFLYRNRSFFYPEFYPGGYEYTPFVMTTEELATIYHFPGDVSRTPTLSRITAKRAEPPANLPI